MVVLEAVALGVLLGAGNHLQTMTPNNWLSCDSTSTSRQRKKSSILSETDTGIRQLNSEHPSVFKIDFGTADP